MRSLTGIESSLLRAVAAVATGSGRRRSLLVLIFHRVLAEPDVLLPSEPDARVFAAQIELLADIFNVMPLQAAAAHIEAGTLPARAACITFDDGYANNYDVALPILRAKGVPATVFVATGFLNGGRMFNDTVIEAVRRAPASADLREFGLAERCLADPAGRVRSYQTILQRLKFLEPTARHAAVEKLSSIAATPLPSDLMLDTTKLQALHRAGIEIGAHTVSHPILCSVSDAVAADEIGTSKRLLEQLLGAPVWSFAYPNGLPGRDYRAAHVAMVKQAGFKVAVSTVAGAAAHGADVLQLPRVGSWDRNSHKFVARMLMAARMRRFSVAS